MTGHGYLAGLVWFTAIFGLTGATTAVLLRGRLALVAGSARAAGAVVVFTAALVAAHVVPLALGALARGSVVLTAAALLALAIALPASPAPAAPSPRGAPDERAALAVAGVAVSAVAAAWLVMLARDATHPVLALDTATFHLPNIARWIQHGTLWRVDQFIPGLAQGNYPENGDVATLGAVLP